MGSGLSGPGSFIRTRVPAASHVTPQGPHTGRVCVACMPATSQPQSALPSFSGSFAATTASLPLWTSPARRQPGEKESAISCGACQQTGQHCSDKTGTRLVRLRRSWRRLRPSTRGLRAPEKAVAEIAASALGARRGCRASVTALSISDCCYRTSTCYDHSIVYRQLIEPRTQFFEHRFIIDANVRI